jgi:hypothetical protein
VTRRTLLVDCRTWSLPIERQVEARYSSRMTST